MINKYINMLDNYYFKMEHFKMLLLHSNINQFLKILKIMMFFLLLLKLIFLWGILDNLIKICILHINLNNQIKKYCLMHSQYNYYIMC